MGIVLLRFSACLLFVPRTDTLFDVMICRILPFKAFTHSLVRFLIEILLKELRCQSVETHSSEGVSKGVLTDLRTWPSPHSATRVCFSQRVMSSTEFVEV